MNAKYADVVSSRKRFAYIEGWQLGPIIPPAAGLTAKVG